MSNLSRYEQSLPAVPSERGRAIGDDEACERSTVKPGEVGPCREARRTTLRTP